MSSAKKTKVLEEKLENEYKKTLQRCSPEPHHLLKAFPDAKLYCYDTSVNPTAQVGFDEGHHEFLVLDKQYLIDMSVRFRYGPNAKLFYDIKNDKDRELISRLYGSPKKWQKVSQPK